MDLIKQRERNKKKQERRFLRRRKQFKKLFLKELKNSYINNEDYFFIFGNENCCYTLSERINLAKEFLDNNKIVYRITPTPENTLGFTVPIQSFRIIFNIDNMNNMFCNCKKLTSIPELNIKNLMKELDEGEK